MMYGNMNEVGSRIRGSCKEGTVSDKYHYLPTTVECRANETHAYWTVELFNCVRGVSMYSYSGYSCNSQFVRPSVLPLLVSYFIRPFYLSVRPSSDDINLFTYVYFSIRVFYEFVNVVCVFDRISLCLLTCPSNTIIRIIQDYYCNEMFME